MLQSQFLLESAEIQVYNNMPLAEHDHILKHGVNPPQYVTSTQRNKFENMV